VRVSLSDTLDDVRQAVVAILVERKAETFAGFKVGLRLHVGASPAGWSCPACTYLNPIASPQCEMCGGECPVASKASSPGRSSGGWQVVTGPGTLAELGAVAKDAPRLKPMKEAICQLMRDPENMITADQKVEQAIIVQPADADADAADSAVRVARPARAAHCAEILEPRTLSQVRGSDAVQPRPLARWREMAAAPIVLVTLGGDRIPVAGWVLPDPAGALPLRPHPDFRALAVAAQDPGKRVLESGTGRCGLSH